MLSYVGSEIDEIRMDHMTFVKIYNNYWGPNQNVPLSELTDRGDFKDFL